ncbi:Alpha-(1,6)-fucosyltransferase, partial [Cichlidogyrus casuarinus]
TNGEPIAWFTGHLLNYILRPKDATLKQRLLAVFGRIFQSSDARALEKELTELGGNHWPDHDPIVGIHVRRTDKAPEAVYHDVSEYMDKVDRYFELREAELQMSNRAREWVGDAQRLRKSKLKRRVMVITEVPSVIDDLMKRYPHYEIVNSKENAKAAKTSMDGRFTFESELSIIVDTIGLSRTDFLVCTLSSNICRSAYEIMQTRHNQLGDASRNIQPITNGDALYHINGYCSSPGEFLSADREQHLKPGYHFTYDYDFSHGLGIIRNGTVTIYTPNGIQPVPLHLLQINKLFSVETIPFDGV